MDDNNHNANANANDLDEPLLQFDRERESDDDDAVFHSARQSSSMMTEGTTGSGSTVSSVSYHGKVSPLSSGMLFPSARGIVDVLPHPTRPCLLYADHDPLGAVAHICLLEKEAERCRGDGVPLPDHPKHFELFATVHVCETLAGRNDPGTRMLRKIMKGGEGLRLPVLLHDGNIFQEGRMRDDKCYWYSAMDCLLPDYIDKAIGKENLLRPQDTVGLYNMNLFIQRHSELPSLFHQLLTHPSPTRRIQLSKRLLDLLKTINADLQKFPDGPYLCGERFTLADAYIYPIVERVVVVLSAYRGFWIPPSLTHLVGWYDAASDRPSVRAATADRSVKSQNTYCYERVVRDEYLAEVYECHARGEAGLFASQNEAGGRPGGNAYVPAGGEGTRGGGGICERRSNCEHCVVS